jgi:hypothetical protein
MDFHDDYDFKAYKNLFKSFSSVFYYYNHFSNSALSLSVQGVDLPVCGLVATIMPSP